MIRWLFIRCFFSILAHSAVSVSLRDSSLSASVAHGVDIGPAPPPHGPRGPGLGQSVRIAGLSSDHGNDSLSVVTISHCESCLSFGQLPRFQSHTAIDLHRTEPSGTWNRDSFGSNKHS